MVFDLKLATLSIKDYNGVHSITLYIGDGTLTFTEKQNIEYVKDRGILYDVRLGDQEPLEVKFDFIWSFLTHMNTDTAPTIEEAIKCSFSGWVSTDTDQCRPPSVDIVIVFTPSCGTESQPPSPETITLTDFRWEQLDHNAKEGMVSCTGKCNVMIPTITRG